MGNKLKSVYLESFRKLKDIKIDIADRVTVIAGHNGIGKSTILGLIANGSEMTTHKSYFDKVFRSQFQEIFHLDPVHDLSGKYGVFLEYEYGQEKIRKKCNITKHKHKDYERLKIVPRTVNDENKLINEKIANIGRDAKIPIPTLYIGMSRVIPIGESDHELYTLKYGTNIHEEDLRYLNEAYREIIGQERMDEHRFSKQDLKYSTKRSIGPSFQDYSYQTVSLGQDSLSSIITAIISFKKIKRELNEGYKGGILVIDEVDACLHPSAQEKLIKVLDKASKALDLQVIVTSHSLTIIKEILGKQLATRQNPADQNLYYNVVYLQNTISPFIMEKPTYKRIKNDMFLKPLQFQDNRQEIKVYFEDDEALFWFDFLLNNLESEIHLDGIRLEKISANIGCDTLLKLPSKDSYFREILIITDGDIKKEQRYREILNTYENICALPGEDSPEKIIHEYLESLVDSPEHHYWRENQHIWHSQFVRDVVLQEINDLTQSANDKKLREHYKEWFRKYEYYFKATEIIKYWMNDNPDDVGEFKYRLNIAIDFLKAHFIRDDF